MAEHRRAHLKSRSPRQELWRDRFKKQCEIRMKDARSSHFHQKRENMWLQKMVMQEWNKFLRDNEAALKLEGAQVTDNLESAIEENLIEELQESYDPTWDELMQLEEEAMADAFESYHSEGSVAGQQGSLVLENVLLTRESSHQWTSTMCYVCRGGSLSAINQGDPSIWECSNCHIHFTHEGMKLLHQHAETCTGNVLYTQNSPEDVIILCTVCELCAAL
ncbi:hypothetical protein BGW37DRAFT_124367 [Umbelopsis sp. PMI_123]|nr:hypothetical protein BGW37DRAFT_124367 [Umbelopsis sp. PMI_123]